MAITLKDVENRYSDLVLDILENIERVVEDLKKEKETAKQIYQKDVQQVYNDQKKEVENKRSEMRLLARANKYAIPRNVVSEIVRLRLVLRNLIKEEIDIERGDAMTFQGHQKRIDNEIKLMDGLLKYIENNVTKTGRKALVGKKRVRVDHPLNITAMYEQIKKVYDIVKSRKIEQNVTKNHLKLKEKIKKQAREVIKMIDAEMRKVGGAQLASTISSVADTKEAESILQRELNAFMREYKIVEEMDGIIKSGSSVKQKRKQLRKLLTQLQRVERMELRARVDKLEKAANRFLADPSLEPGVRKQIRDAIERLKVFEAQTIVETVKALGPKIKKMETEADVVEVQKQVAKVERATQAATVEGQKAKRAIDAVKRGTEMRKKLIEEGKKTVGRVRPKQIEYK